MAETEIHRICLFGGTFDPPHLGHLVLAEQARVAYEFEKIIFLPSGDPPMRQGTSASGENRVAMLEAIVGDNPYFEVDRREIDREGQSFTWITVEEYLFERPDTDLFFIVGADQVSRFDRWERIDWLLDIVKFIPAFRPPYGPEIFESLKGHLKSAAIEAMTERTIEMPQLMISSTELRWWISQGRSVRYLMPDSVIEYIKEHNLYQDRGHDPLAFFGE